jgi:hypothetical protein
VFNPFIRFYRVDFSARQPLLFSSCCINPCGRRSGVTWSVGCRIVSLRLSLLDTPRDSNSYSAFISHTAAWMAVFVESSHRLRPPPSFNWGYSTNSCCLCHLGGFPVPNVGAQACHVAISQQGTSHDAQPHSASFNPRLPSHGRCAHHSRSGSRVIKPAKYM